MTLLDGAGCETDSAKRERRDYMNAPAHGSVVDGDVEEDARPAATISLSAEDSPRARGRAARAGVFLTSLSRLGV